MFPQSIPRRRSAAFGIAFAAIVTVALAACGSDATPEQVAAALPRQSTAVPTAVHQATEPPASPSESTAVPTTAHQTTQPPASPPESSAVPTTAPPQPAPVVKVGNSVGDHIPDFELRLGGGLTASSAALLAERRPAFLFFFATW